MLGFTFGTTPAHSYVPLVAGAWRMCSARMRARLGCARSCSVVRGPTRMTRCSSCATSGESPCVDIVSLCALLAATGGLTAVPGAGDAVQLEVLTRADHCCVNLVGQATELGLSRLFRVLRLHLTAPAWSEQVCGVRFCRRRLFGGLQRRDIIPAPGFPTSDTRSWRSLGATRFHRCRGWHASSNAGGVQKRCPLQDREPGTAASALAW